MDRRSTLLALGGAIPVLLATRSLRAQEADTAQTDSADGSMSPTPDTRHAITPASAKMKTLQWGTLAKLTSVIAFERSTSNTIREFAKYEIFEQDSVAKALTSLAKPPPAPLTGVQHEVLDMVKNASAADLDATYVKAQIGGHERLLQIQDNLLSGTQPLTSDAVHISLVARSFIEYHLYVLRNLAAGTTP